MAITAGVFVLFISVVLQLQSFAKKEHSKGGMTRFLLTPRLVAPGSNVDGMPVSLYDTLKSIDGVKAVARRYYIPGRHPSGATYLVGGDEEAGIELNPDVYPITPAEFDAWKKDRIGAIVTDATARDLNLHVGETAEVPTGSGPMRIKVLAITKGALLPQLIGVHLEYMQEFTKITNLCGYRVYTEPADAARVADEIAERTKNSSMPVLPVDSNSFRAGVVKQAATIPVVLGFLGLFLILTTGLTLANSSAISIRDRRIEAATLRVLGFQRHTIVSVFVGEAVLIGLIGGLIAIAVISILLGGEIKIGAGLFPEPLSQTVTIGWLAMLGGALLSILVPLAGALPSAVLSVRVPLLDGLRDSA